MKSSRQSRLLPKLLLHVASHKREGGYVVLLAVSATIVITSLLAAYYTITSIETSTSLASLNSNYGFDAAEAGLNVRAEDVRQVFQGFNLPGGNDPDITGANDPCTVGNQGTGDFTCQTFDFNNYSVQSFLVRQDGEPDDPPISIQVPAGEDFAFLNAQEYRYSAFATATRQGDDDPQAILQMVFRSRLIPLFQFAAFYENDLEILPGPEFDLRGRVHTNGDLYLNANNRLTINGSVTVAGDLYRGRKNNTSCNGNVSVTTSSASYPVTCASGRRGPIDENIDSEVAASNGLIDVEFDELQLPPIQAFDPDPSNPNSEYFAQADLRLVLNIDAPTSGAYQANDITLFDGTTVVDISSDFPAYGVVRPEIRLPDGTVDVIRTNALNSCTSRPDVFPFVQSAPPSPLDPNEVIPPVYLGGANDGHIVNGPDSNEELHGYFNNVRESTEMILMDVNVRQLFDCIYEGNYANDLTDGIELGDQTQGGLVIHMTVAADNVGDDPMAGKTPGTPNNFGVRLWNAEALDLSNPYDAAYLAPPYTTSPSPPPEIRGLTIVTDIAMYVQGNYNCSRRDGSGGFVNGCSPDATTGTLDDDLNSRYPASLLADSMNILSNSWNVWTDDRVYTGDGPNASETTVYAAFLAGTETTGVEGSPGGAYGGGLENYPRFHERWSGVRNFYRGSLVSLGNPRYVSGSWGNQQYRPPQRDWNYELRFNSASGLPPLSPRFVVLRQELFVRNFDR
ncbi:MAG: hypothetical protein AAGA40_13730 [Cyanobacteria bacterium P01_E01_bin.45]